LFLFRENSHNVVIWVLARYSWCTGWIRKCRQSTACIVHKKHRKYCRRLERRTNLYDLHRLRNSSYIRYVS